MILMFDFVLNNPYVKIVLVKNNIDLCIEAIIFFFLPPLGRQAMLYCS